MAIPKRPRFVTLRGVRVHNLKGIDLDLPLDRLVVVTGVSGAGKSSLAFDTLYAEGQRRYIETFSPATRQFLEVLDKPDADRVDGVPPAIGIAQRSGRRSARGTVGTMTEVHEDLALLFARVGRVSCLACGAPVQPADPIEVVRAIAAFPERTRYQVAFPVDVLESTDLAALARGLRGEGFLRVQVDGAAVSLDEDTVLPRPRSSKLDVIVDRLVRGAEDPGRQVDSIETAFAHGLGRCRILVGDDATTFHRGWRCGDCGRDHLAPEPRLFRFHSPLGACPTCEGLGHVIDIDLNRVVPDATKSLRDGAIAPWAGAAHGDRRDELLAFAAQRGIPVDRPFQDLDPDHVRSVLYGAPGFPGLRGFLRALEARADKVAVRVFLGRWRGETPCPACLGARLRPEALAVKVAGTDIAALSAQAIAESRRFLEELPDAGDLAARRALAAATRRLGLLERIGLGHLTLDRPARTLSTGEARRVAIAGAVGSGLVRTLYVLDEPAIGLHPSDVGKLLDVLKSLRDAGNSVVAVEHDEAIVRAADFLVDIGPGAGDAGGRLLHAGPPDQVVAVAESATGQFLAGRFRPSAGTQRRRSPKGHIVLRGALGHNLKGIDVSFPLGVFCVVTGVSGAGKSSLVEETLYPALLKRTKQADLTALKYEDLIVCEGVDAVVMVDQAPIGRSGRSNPVTFLKAFDEVRKVFAETHEAKLRNYGPGRFSFNVSGGRCDACEGDGHQTIDMRFLADVVVRCPECRGRRFRAEVLEVTYRGKNIAEVLEMTVREAFAFFHRKPRVQARLRPLLEVGLDYLRLGQPASTLSAGEAQRLKLAKYLATSSAALARAASGPRTLFILDEPTSGLHPADVMKLLEALNWLVDRGDSLIVVEHDLQVVLAADWVIDLGPGPGAAGGRVVALGTPEEVAASGSATGEEIGKRLTQSNHAER